MVRKDGNMPKDQKASGNFPYGHFFNIMGGKWKPYLMVVIHRQGSIRFNEMVKKWGVTSKVLSQQLRELEHDGLIHRVASVENNLPRTDYLLTEEGEKVIPILKEIYKWGLDDMKRKNLYIDPRTYDYIG